MNLAHMLPDTAWRTFSSKSTKAFTLVLTKVDLGPISKQTLGSAHMQLLGESGAYMLTDF